MVDNQEMNFRVFSASTVPLARPGLRSAGRLLRSGLVTGTALVFLFAASTHLAAQEVAEPVRLVPVVAAIQETRAAEVTTLDVDWFYRRLGPVAARRLDAIADAGWDGLVSGVGRSVRAIATGVHRLHGPGGILARPWPTGSMAFWATVMLALYSILSYL